MHICTFFIKIANLKYIQGGMESFCRYKKWAQQIEIKNYMFEYSTLYDLFSDITMVTMFI